MLPMQCCTSLALASENDRRQAWNPADPPPAITVHVVAGLGPRFLVEIDAIAVV
jgi:enamine deaminase RidA (YjgF/YER057c/UK114 family)